MIIEIPNENSIIKWKNNDKDEWKSAEISDLVKAYERPKGEWLSLSDVSPSGFGTWVCSQCGHGFRGIKSKMPYCTCGADMRGE